ncbi:stress-response A/B barrel domain-containing protein UP3-like [Diospyros lotus]|uniref:stress-response A/B barrel domain-containing protein UP3-like n=1 Tax=Diospyros lotus TaxID=55363 RepID=UPI0022560F72|nr:stress-response A/B barrel domain-containing protein UP3-like [Diospyros lotus]
MSQIVEHIVLSKVKDNADPSLVNGMFDGLNALKSLDQVLYLTAGKLLRVRSPSDNFTNVVHARYKSKDDLTAYSLHPDHVKLGKQYSEHIIDDFMALDWVAADFDGPVAPPPGSQVEIAFMKLRGGLGEEEKEEVLAAIGGIAKDCSGSGCGLASQINYGENFSPRCKGFSVGLVAVYPDLKSLEEENVVKLVEERVGEKLEHVIVFDYIVPPPYPPYI